MNKNALTVFKRVPPNTYKILNGYESYYVPPNKYDTMCVCKMLLVTIKYECTASDNFWLNIDGTQSSLKSNYAESTLDKTYCMLLVDPLKQKSMEELNQAQK